MTFLFIFTIWLALQIPIGIAVGKYLKLVRTRR